MKRKKVLSCILVAATLLATLCLSSCDKTKTKYSSYSLEYFDTATSITGYADSKEEFDAISDQILSELAEYHKLFTIYNRYDAMENLCSINDVKNNVHQTVVVDKKIIDMLVFSKEMYKETNGKVNIAMGSLLSIWHDYRTAGINDPQSAQLPPEEKLKQAGESINIDHLIIDTKNNTVFISDPKTKLDVGAIAKGYAVEMIAQGLEKEGISGYVINVGGNVRTIGTKADGQKWLVGIENPESDSKEPYIAYLELSGEALVTSGTYQRFYTVGDKKYHHIIDPDTLYPAEGYQSISVVCENSANGDALSTALFCMEYEEGSRLVESLEGVEVLWVFEDGSQKQSSGFKNYIKK